MDSHDPPRSPAQSDRTDRTDRNRPPPTVRPPQSPEHPTDDSESWRSASLNMDTSTTTTQQDSHYDQQSISTTIGGDSAKRSDRTGRTSEPSSDRSSSVKPQKIDRHGRVTFGSTSISIDGDDPSIGEEEEEDGSIDRSIPEFGDLAQRRMSMTERKRSYSFYKSNCFHDGIRPIDMVLSYVVLKSKKSKKEKTDAQYRAKFERMLIEQGFELEYEHPKDSFDGKTGFVKLHAPYSLLESQAELRNVQKPFMESDVAPDKPSKWKRLSAKLWGRDPFTLQEQYRKEHKEYFTDVFDRERKEDFLNHDDELAFFTSAQRILLCWDLISSTTMKLDDEAVEELKKEAEKEQKEEKKPDTNPEAGGSEDETGRNRASTEDSDNTTIDPAVASGAILIDEHPRNGPVKTIDGSISGHSARNGRRNGPGAVSMDPDPGRGQYRSDPQSDPNRSIDKPPAPQRRTSSNLSDAITNESIMNERQKTVSFHFLQQMGVYKSCYPLHDGDTEGSEEELQRTPMEDWPLRKYLYESWARPRQWRFYQPIHPIRDYYGEKVGLYFAWIGFYTKMLILPSIMGVLVVLYGLAMPYASSHHDITATICRDVVAGEAVICPDCPTVACPFTRLKNYCTLAKIAAIFDNNGTVFFSVFMALWAVCFLEGWKRYRSKLCVDWDVTDDEFASEAIRPEYMLRVPDMRMNPVTMKLEPHLKLTNRLKRVAASMATVLFFIFIVVALLAAVMVYKVVGPTWWRNWLGEKGEDGADEAKERSQYALIVSITSSVVNGLFIGIMAFVYQKFAWLLTQAEFPRTEREFEDSYTYKVFTFQCVNFYGALFYLALIRGRVSVPPHKQNYETRCPVSGCIVDVTIQLAVIFVGKQAINNLMELGIPLIMACIRRCKRKSAQKKREIQKDLPVWERDFLLQDPQRILLFGDYLELLIQYGFTTMFVAAFPLAPLFAFLNNIIEIRLDAYKNLVLTQRCIPLRAKNIGPWYKLLVIVTRIAVITNALFIAFTTQFVDRLVFKYIDGREWLKQHFTSNVEQNLLFFTFSVFNISDSTRTYDEGGSTKNITIVEAGKQVNDTATVGQCYYVDYRHPPNDAVDPYDRSVIWWHVFAARLVFVILFEHFVFLFQSLLAYFIPDVPNREKQRITREKHLIKAGFLQRELGVQHDEAAGRPTPLNPTTHDDKEDSDDFVPDELPDWLDGAGSPEVSTVGGTMSRIRRGQRGGQQHRRDEEDEGGRVPRGKVLVRKAQPQKKRRPFMLMLFKKLSLCD